MKRNLLEFIKRNKQIVDFSKRVLTGTMSVLLAAGIAITNVTPSSAGGTKRQPKKKKASTSTQHKTSGKSHKRKVKNKSLQVLVENTMDEDSETLDQMGSEVDAISEDDQNEIVSQEETSDEDLGTPDQTDSEADDSSDDDKDKTVTKKESDDKNKSASRKSKKRAKTSEAAVEPQLSEEEIAEIIRRQTEESVARYKQEAEEKEDVLAMYHLVYYYSQEEKNEEEAKRWFGKLLEQAVKENKLAIYCVANCYEKGLLIEDKGMALAYYENAYKKLKSFTTVKYPSEIKDYDGKLNFVKSGCAQLEMENFSDGTKGEKETSNFKVTYWNNKVKKMAMDNLDITSSWSENLSNLQSCGQPMQYKNVLANLDSKEPLFTVRERDLFDVISDYSKQKADYKFSIHEAYLNRGKGEQDGQAIVYIKKEEKSEEEKKAASEKAKRKKAVKNEAKKKELKVEESKKMEKEQNEVIIVYIGPRFGKKHHNEFSKEIGEQENNVQALFCDDTLIVREIEVEIKPRSSSAGLPE